MGVFSSLALLVRDATRLDRSQILPINALRNTVGVMVPLAAGAATGHLLAGLTVAIGALNVAVSDRPAPYRLVAGRMLLAGLFGALSVFVGAATGAVGWLVVVLAALWGFAGGLLVALGPAAAQIGSTGIILLIVFGGQPASPAQALASAGLVLGGAAFQTLLAVAAWPVHPFAPQRAALAELFRQLAAAARAPLDPGAAPPVTAAVSAARASLAAGGDRGAEGEALRSLLDEAERIRLELLTLADLRRRLDADQDAGALATAVARALDAAGEVLVLPARQLDSRHASTIDVASLQRIEAATNALRHPQHPIDYTGRRPELAAALRHLEALGGQLRAALEIAAQANAGEAEIGLWSAGSLRVPRLHSPLATLRANLTRRAAAGRHALRLAGCLAIATALARGFGVSHAYWLPMTVAIILKPDFGATLRFSLIRAVATLLGLLIATGLAFTLFTGLQERIALVALLMFVLRALGPANYALLVLPLTALVVILTSFAGAPPEATILERGIFTAAGSVLAVVIFVAWPTWERSQARSILADLLDAYRRYFLGVMGRYLEPGADTRGELDEARQAARLARSNAEASVERLRAEPARTGDRDRLVGLLAASHRFALSAAALEAGAVEGKSALDQPEVRAFVRDVDATLQALSRALRDPSCPPHDLPDLRADQRALAEALGGASAQQALARPDDRLVSLAHGADRITDSVNTMTQVLTRRDEEPAAPSVARGA